MNYIFVEDQNGMHQIGGDVPPAFTVPDNEFIAGFQYLGYIDNSDPFFAWLPFKVNLIHPIYTDEYSVYLDYTNPAAPAIIEPLDTALSTSAFYELDKHSIILFEGLKVSAQEQTNPDDYNTIGVCGEPQWAQAAALPICPKTGKAMRFLCQLNSYGVKSTYTNVEPSAGMAIYFEFMNFWCDGSLYIYLEPTSKTVCYTMQNT